jgi:2-dehydropantoate 2-reductase
LAAAVVDSHTSIVSLQNGWGNGQVLAERFGSDRILVGVTYNSATVVEPGVVAHTAGGPTHIGPLDGASLDTSVAFAGLLRESAFVAEASAGIEREIWKKLVLNAATLPAAALTGLDAGSLEANEETRSLVDALADEAIDVAIARGYAVDREERRSAIHGILERAGAGKPSMLQDFESGRRTEIDVINGAIVRAGEAAGVDVPVNRALVALVKGWEHARGLA